jgi:hypothetical protein
MRFKPHCALEFRRAADLFMMLSSLACTSSLCVDQGLDYNERSCSTTLDRTANAARHRTQKLAPGLLFFHWFGDVEDLTQVGEIGLVLAHVLAGGIGEFGHGLTVAANHLDHDLQRFCS